jgi:hypothetical protein
VPIAGKKFPPEMGPLSEASWSLPRRGEPSGTSGGSGRDRRCGLASSIPRWVTETHQQRHTPAYEAHQPHAIRAGLLM